MMQRTLPFQNPYEFSLNDRLFPIDVVGWLLTVVVKVVDWFVCFMLVLMFPFLMVRNERKRKI